VLHCKADSVLYFRDSLSTSEYAAWNVGIRDIATGYRLYDRGVGVRVKNFHFFISFRQALGPTQPPIQWVPGVLSTGVKRPES
jgi:hypothetical protein